MWLRLEDGDLDQIELSLNNSLRDNQDPENRQKIFTLRERIRKWREPDPDTSRFCDAVLTNDDFNVDSDAVISRGDDGAFVMAWTWVSNESAGFVVCEECDELYDEHEGGCPHCEESDDEED